LALGKSLVGNNEFEGDVYADGVGGLGKGRSSGESGKGKKS